MGGQHYPSSFGMQCCPVSRSGRVLLKHVAAGGAGVLLMGCIGITSISISNRSSGSVPSPSPSPSCYLHCPMACSKLSWPWLPARPKDTCSLAEPFPHLHPHALRCRAAAAVRLGRTRTMMMTSHHPRPRPLPPSPRPGQAPQGPRRTRRHGKRSGARTSSLRRQR